VNDKSKKIFTIASGIFVVLFIIASAVNAILSTPKSDKGNIHTTDLQYVSIHEGNTDTCYYVNEDNEIFCPSNMQYAIVVKKYDESGRLVSESYFDEDSNPVTLNNNYSSYTVSYDDLITTYRYLDSQGNLVNRNEGYAILVREYLSNLSGDYIERYYDVNNQRTSISAGYSGIKKCFDDELLISSTYLDNNDQPVNNIYGVSTIVRTYYENNKLETEMYFGEDGNSSTDSLGRYGIRIDSYDENGRRERVTSLDAYGNPMSDNRGYATTILTYTDWGSTRTEMFFDVDGNPCTSGKNLYGILHDGERTYSLNADGTIAPTIDTLLMFFPIVIVIVGIITCLMFCFLPKKARDILLILYLLFIAFETIFFREASNQRIQLDLFKSYAGFWSKSGVREHIFNNIWLFIPCGTGLYSVTKNKKIIALSLLVPALIEVVQGVTGIGLLETADVVNNELGLIIGSLIYTQFIRVKRYK